MTTNTKMRRRDRYSKLFRQLKKFFFYLILILPRERDRRERRACTKLLIERRAALLSTRSHHSQCISTLNETAVSAPWAWSKASQKCTYESIQYYLKFTLPILLEIAFCALRYHLLFFKNTYCWSRVLHTRLHWRSMINASVATELEWSAVTKHIIGDKPRIRGNATRPAFQGKLGCQVGKQQLG